MWGCTVNYFVNREVILMICELRFQVTLGNSYTKGPVCIVVDIGTALRAMWLQTLEKDDKCTGCLYPHRLISNIPAHLG